MAVQVRDISGELVREIDRQGMPVAGSIRTGGDASLASAAANARSSSRMCSILASCSA